MGFSITGGSPGLLGAVMIVLGVTGVLIFLFFILKASKDAHDEIEDEVEP